MGNEQTCCLEEDLSKFDHIEITKSTIHPIKHGYRKAFVSQNQNMNIARENKRIFSGTMNGQKGLQKISIAQKYNQNLPTSQYLEMSFGKQIKQQYEIKNDLNKETKTDNSQSTTSYKFPSINTSIVSNRDEDEDIIIQFLPIVSKLISILSITFPIIEPFEKELSLINDGKVKKIKINKGKDIYKGQLNEFHLPHGFGMIVKSNGSIIMGKFQEGLIQGDSFFIHNNGSYYKGKMKNSVANDVEGYFHSKQLSYRGGFQNNYFHGKCQQIGDDYHFKGIYENNLKRNGVLSWQIKKINKAHDMPQYNTSNASNRQSLTNISLVDSELYPIRDFSSIPKFNYVYEGYFDVHQLFTGKATLKDSHGTYIGNFHQGLKNGKGQYEYATMIKYVGDYQNDERCGYGILFNYDGTIAYEGQFKKGLPDGKGCSYDLSGNKTQGQFIDGLNRNILSK